MEESAPDPYIIPCESCGRLIDTSTVPPLSQVACPDCDHPQVVNTHFHHFQLLEVLGSGGMGSVYRALDESLDRTVALKLLKSEHMTDGTLTAQFEKEAAVTGSINHPHVVKIFSTGMDHGTVYMVMELVDQGSLDDLITKLERVGEVRVLEVGIQIAQGLQAAWRNGLLHRDVKPGNILFGDAHTAKIVDFGLAALADESVQIGGEVWGTPYYVAPEKLEPTPTEDFRSDIYSLGSALFHALAGRPPYEAEDAAIVTLRALKRQPVSLRSFAPDVSPTTTLVIDRMLRQDPAARYQSYDELIEHLQYAHRELTEKAQLPMARPAPKKRATFLPWLAAALALGGGAYYLLTHRPAPKLVEAPATPAPVYAADAAERSAEARRLLIASELPKAIDAFRDLDRDNFPPSLRLWNALQRAWAEMLAGQPADAARTLEPIVKPAPGSPPADPPAEFLRETAALLTSPTLPPVEQAAAWNPATHESLALLIAGTRHWSAGDVTSALPFFTRFQSATPGEPHAWLAEYRPFAASYLADHAAFQRATTAATAAASDVTKKKDALATTREARTQLRHRSPLAEQLATLESQLTADVTAQDAEMARQMAAFDQADAAMLKGAQTRLDQHCRYFQMAEARTLVTGLQLRGTQQAPLLDLLRRKVTWLTAYKAGFFADLLAVNYRGQVQNAMNSPVGSGIWQPRETFLHLVFNGSSLDTPWTNVSAQSILTAARSSIHNRLTPGQLAERRWGLGLYLLTWGRAAEAHPLLTQAAAARPEYGEALSQLGLTAP